MFQTTNQNLFWTYWVSTLKLWWFPENVGYAIVNRSIRLETMHIVLHLQIIDLQGTYHTNVESIWTMTNKSLAGINLRPHAPQFASGSIMSISLQRCD